MAGRPGQWPGHATAMASREPAGSPAVAPASRGEGKRSRRTLGSPGARKGGRRGRRRSGGGAIGGGGARVCGENRRRRRLLWAQLVDSSRGQEEDGEVVLLGWLGKQGEARNADDGRRPSSVPAGVYGEEKQRGREHQGEKKGRRGRRDV
jgi:hypothetical protein